MPNILNEFPLNDQQKWMDLIFEATKLAEKADEMEKVLPLSKFYVDFLKIIITSRPHFANNFFTSQPSFRDQVKTSLKTIQIVNKIKYG